LIILFITRTQYSLNILFLKQCIQTNIQFIHIVLSIQQRALPKILTQGTRKETTRLLSSASRSSLITFLLQQPVFSLPVPTMLKLMIYPLLTPKAPSEVEYYANSTNLFKLVVLGRIIRGFVIFNEEPFEPSHC